jgi:hypothetical protein
MRSVSHEVLWSAMRPRIAFGGEMQYEGKVPYVIRGLHVKYRFSKRREDAHALQSPAIAGQNKISP